MKRRILVVVFTLLSAISITSAQSTATCASIIEEAFTDVGTNCANLDNNTLCYGYDSVTAEFVEDIANTPDEPTLEQPSDRVNLIDLNSITTAPLSVEDEEYGLAVLRTQANLPTSTIDDQAVVLVSMGEVTIVDEVPVDQKFVPQDVVNITVESESGSTQFVSFPPDWDNRASEEVATIENGEVFEVDAITTDGEWLRANYQYDSTSFSSRSTAWVNVNDVNQDADLSNLAAMTPLSRAPFQSISLTNEFDDPSCDEQPQSQLLVQGPSTIESELTINNLDVRVSSTMIAYIVSDDGQPSLRLIPVTSYIVIPDPSAPDDIDRAIVVEAGQYIDVCHSLDEDGRLTVCPEWINSFSQQKQIFEDSLSEGGNYLSRPLTRLISLIRFIAGNIFNYPIDQTPIIISPSGVGNPIPIFDASIPRPRNP